MKKLFDQLKEIRIFSQKVMLASVKGHGTNILERKFMGHQGSGFDRLSGTYKYFINKTPKR